MKNLNRAFIDDLLSRIDIVEIINDRVNLKQQGNSYKGLCPFHAENTPSFTVSNSKQFYHCFGCGASGDVIKFLQEYEGLTFVEAVEKLALQANIKIPETNSDHSDYHDRLIKVNNFVSSLFKKNLENNTKAQKYLESRNITNKEIELFSIGFANDSWDTITQILKQKKILKEGKELGLLTESKGKTYDRFRNRIIFPIKNTMGNVIAFGGRTLDKNETAKYINSPESKLFYKSSQVYGLFESKQSINKKNQIIVVEGYTDVISLHANGFKNVVATLGTAFTKSHLNKILRYTKNIIFCFDGDEAGKKAAWKALINSLSEIRDNIDIEFTFLPDGKDPDQLCMQNGKESFQDLLSTSMPFSEFLFDNLKINLDLTKVEDKSKFITSITSFIQQIPVGVFRTLMEEKLSTLTNIERGELFRSIQTKDAKPSDTKLEKDLVADVSEDYILSILLEYPSLLSPYEDKIFPLIENATIKNILKKISMLNKKNDKNNASIIMENLPEEKDFIQDHITKELVDKDIESSSETLKSVILTLEKRYLENEYFSILQKHSNGEKLTEKEKKLLKDFKK
tara:strand:- start:24485 stop:26191 length:1707 start_codon:yes stop_codon:yes gene_type:complete